MVIHAGCNCRLMFLRDTYVSSKRIRRESWEVKAMTVKDASTFLNPGKPDCNSCIFLALEERSPLVLKMIKEPRNLQRSTNEFEFKARLPDREVRSR